MFQSGAWVVLGIAILIIIRGSYGIVRLSQGYGAQIFSVYNHLASRAGEHTILMSYATWLNSILWVGTKRNPTKSERAILLVTSVIQVLAGIFFISAVKI